MIRKCFVIQPFDNGPFDKRYEDIIEPVVKKLGMERYRVDEDPAAVIPMESVEKNIKDSWICIADITTDNPNVWFETGYAIAHGKRVILICAEERRTKPPFDIQHRRVIFYKTESKSDFVELEERISNAIQASWKEDFHILRPDGEGYYEASIVEDRKVPDKKGRSFRCYRLDGLVECPRLPLPVDGKTHWLFFEVGSFVDLKVGDRVRFLIQDVTNLRKFRGAENTRNVYLDDLIKIEN